LRNLNIERKAFLNRQLVHHIYALGFFCMIFHFTMAAIKVTVWWMTIFVIYRQEWITLSWLVPKLCPFLENFTIPLFEVNLFALMTFYSSYRQVYIVVMLFDKFMPCSLGYISLQLFMLAHWACQIIISLFFLV
jgi:hypothetical protein